MKTRVLMLGAGALAAGQGASVPGSVHTAEAAPVNIGNIMEARPEAHPWSLAWRDPAAAMMAVATVSREGIWARCVPSSAPRACGALAGLAGASPSPGSIRCYEPNRIGCRGLIVITSLSARPSSNAPRALVQ